MKLSWNAVAGALVVSLWAVPTSAATPWWQRQAPCPDDATLIGAAPPVGFEIGCIKPSGVWHGIRTVWVEDCATSHDCDVRQPPIRYEGDYRRGIEHGHWVWFHRHGIKGLEGEYFAGRKVGTWMAWDKAGNPRKSQMEPPPTGTIDADAAILSALKEASKMGNKDLAKELELASRDLKRAGQTGAPTTVTRSSDTSQNKSVGAKASTSGGLLDLPDQDLGTTSFGVGIDQEASPYVKQITQAATRRIEECYRNARVQNPKLTGTLTVRYVIAPNGHCTQALVIKSDLPEAMNSCVRRALTGAAFQPSHLVEPVEIITPWTFRAPSH